MKAREVACKECGVMIARGKVANKTAHATFCLPCLAKHPEATFGDRLKAYRVAAGLTRSELAQLTGVQLTTIANYERSEGGDPQWSRMRRLVRVLGVGILGLEGLTGDKER